MIRKIRADNENLAYIFGDCEDEKDIWKLDKHDFDTGIEVIISILREAGFIKTKENIMKKLSICVLLLVLCGIVFGQIATNAEYPNTEPFMDFWQKLRTDVADGKIDLTKNYDFRIQGKFADRKVSNGDLKFEINENSPELLDHLKRFLSAVDESNLLKVIAVESLGEKINAADLNVKFNDSDVDFKLSLDANSETTARNIASRFSLLLSLTARFVEGGPEEEFYKNAVVASEKDQILVSGKISRKNLVKYIRYGNVGGVEQ